MTDRESRGHENDRWVRPVRAPRSHALRRVLTGVTVLACAALVPLDRPAAEPSPSGLAAVDVLCAVLAQSPAADRNAARASALEQLAAKLAEGAPFAALEVELLKRHLSGGSLDPVEADLLLSRALLAREQPDAVLTPEQEDLLARYAELGAKEEAPAPDGALEPGAAPETAPGNPEDAGAPAEPAPREPEADRRSPEQPVPATTGTPENATNTQGFLREQEPNDTPATARPLGGMDVVAFGNVWGASGTYTGDLDYWSFSGLVGDRIYVATQGAFSATAVTGDTFIDLLDSNGTTVLEGDDNDCDLGTSSSTIAGKALPASGTFYIRVRSGGGFPGNTTVRPYQLHFRQQRGVPTPELEGNDTPATANPLTGGWVSGVRGSATDVDYYSFAANAGDTIFLSLDLDPERNTTTWNARLGIGQFGDAQNQILVVNDSNGTGNAAAPPSEALFMTVKTAGTYYAVVEAPTAIAFVAGVQTYNLSLGVHPATALGVNCTTWSTNVPATIPAGGGQVDSTIFVPGNPRIEDLNLEIQLNHALMADIDAALLSPAGNENSLFTDDGAAAIAGQTVMDIGLDDEAGCPVPAGGAPGLFQYLAPTPPAAPVAATAMRGLVYQPEVSRLGWFKGELAGGNWTLRLRDDLNNASGGTLTGWSLTICEPPAATSCGFPLTTVYSSDFEANDGGFTSAAITGTNNWARGTPTAAPITTCASGSNCWKTNLTGIYSASSNMELKSPAISLAGMAPPIRLTWNQKYQMQTANNDHAYVLVREAGTGANPRKLWEWLDGTMTEGVGTTGALINQSAGWGLVTANLDAYVGKTIEVVFHLDSNATAPKLAGLAVDDVTVTAVAASFCADGDPCTVDRCDPAAGTCTHTPSLCCVAGVPTVCNDLNPCTADACDESTGGCLFTPTVGASCNDQSACTTADSCGPATTCNTTFASENFDLVVAPALPAGWTTNAFQGADVWVTTTAANDTPLNSAFGIDSTTTSDHVLTSPAYAIPAGGAQLTFRNRWQFENTTSFFDGGMLEISIGGGTFQDILSAGGSFATGGYTGTLSTLNPLGARSAWTGSSSGYPAFLTTTVNLPAAARGQSVVLRWRVSTDSSNTTTFRGQEIDTIRLNSCTSVCGGTPVTCTDNNLCTADTCNPATGCVFTPDPTGCDDGNPCTDDSCATGSCLHTFNTAPCNDGVACTVNDVCSNGVCAGTPPAACNDGNPCTTDSCLVTGQVLQFNVASLLNSDVVVNNGAPGPAFDPSQESIGLNTLATNNFCFMSQSVAVASAGALTPNGLPDSAFFAANGFHPDVQLAFRNNQDYTTGTNARRITSLTESFFFDVTPAIYSFVHLYLTSGDGQSHCIVTFTYSDSTTSAQPLTTVEDWFNDPADTATAYRLIDGLDRMQPGSGPGTQFQFADANDPAIFGYRFTPDPARTLTRITITRSDSATSSVLDFFGGVGVLLADACTHTTLTCDDGNVCTADSCDPASGSCTHTTNPTACDDGNACTADTCNPSNGTCAHTITPNVPCSDGSLCTTGDTCNASGVCVGTAITCNDSNPCTDDSCVAAIGCVFTGAPGRPCNDSNPCTTGDTCGTSCVQSVASERFDSVTAPALPAGWTGALWRTVTTASDTPPNAAFTDDPGTVSDRTLDSPTFALPLTPSQLTFRNRVELESGFDCGVLEIKIGAGAFQDILAAGGTFVGGGYNGTCSACCGNPLANRAVWTGNPSAGTFFTTTVNLPAAALGQSVVFRFRVGTDTTVAGTGQWVDTIAIGSACNTTCLPGGPTSCDDGNPCTTDSCDPAAPGGCVHTNNNASCNDGNACTFNDTCSNGVCVGGAPVVCNDNNVCTTDSCLPAPVPVQFDVTSVLNADVIVNNGSGVNDPTQDPIDAGPLPNGTCFMTQSVAVASAGALTPNGLPDNAFYPANALHPDVQLLGANSQPNAGLNARRITALSDMFNFTVPPDSYSQVHVFFTAGDAQGFIDAHATITLNYGDATSQSTPVAVPDWFNDPPDPDFPTESFAMYRLIDGRDRMNPVSFGFADANDPAIFGYGINADPARTLVSITIVRSDPMGTSARVLDFFGALGVRSAGCSFVPNAAPCDDANPCTVGDVCGAGTCHPGTTPLDCNDNNPCTADTCSATVPGGCVNTCETIPPVVVPPPSTTAECDAVPAAGTPTVTDNCDPSPTVLLSSETSTQTPNGCSHSSYTITRTWTGRDSCGNTSTATQVITVTDTRAPSITTAAANLTVECDGAGNTADLNAWRAAHGGASASDACGSVTWTDDFTALTPGCGRTGSATVTFTAHDDCGNQASTTATFTILDRIAPAIVTPAASQTVECDGSGNAAALAAWLASHGGAAASDVCGAVSWTNDFTALSDGCGATGSATVTFTAHDECGNTSTTAATFTIVDTTRPSITTQASNQTVECDGAGNAAELNAWLASHGGASASDACSAVTWTNDFTSLSDGCGATGSATVTFTAADACSNTSTTTATFTIVDTTAPVLAGVPGPATVECSNVPPPASPTATDTCDSSPTITFMEMSNQTGSGCGTGTFEIRRTWTAHDACGNTSSQTQVLTVRDTSAPVPTAVLEPAAPRPPSSPRSACSAPSRRQFLVRCSATDNCDPSPTTTAVLRITNHDVVNHVCVTRVEDVAVACDELVDLVLVARACPAHPHPPVSATSAPPDEPRVFTGEQIELRVTATDVCGNSAVATYDPTTVPAPPCSDHLPDGTCCPPIGRPEDPECRVPLCGSLLREGSEPGARLAPAPGALTDGSRAG